MIMKTSILYVYLAFIILVGCHQNKPVVILEDGFEHIRRGPEVNGKCLLSDIIFIIPGSSEKLMGKMYCGKNTIIKISTGIPWLYRVTGFGAIIP